MKGNKIINEMNRAKMPDIEQVREACHAAQNTAVWNTSTQSQTSGRFGLRRLRLGTAMLMATVALIFAGSAAYAVGVAVGIIGAGERLDVGGRFQYVFVPAGDPEYLERWDAAFHALPIFITSHTGSPWHSLFYRSDGFETRFSAARAAWVNAELEGQIFLADGSPFPYDLIVEEAGQWIDEGLGAVQSYRADSRGHELYNADGEHIGIINAMEQHGVFQSVWIVTLAEHLERDGYINTLEEVEYALGATVRLPNRHLEDYAAPVFNASPGRSGVSAVFAPLNEDGYLQRIWMQFETVRTDDTPWEHLITGQATLLEIAGNPVYQITTANGHTHFTWEHEGIIYRLYLPFTFMYDVITPVFSNQQIYEMIAGMME